MLEHELLHRLIKEKKTKKNSSIDQNKKRLRKSKEKLEL